MSHLPKKPVRTLGVFTLSMVSVSAIIALRNLPTLAKNGFSVVFMLALAALLFFIPLALACAELASGWPKTGGVYAWVKEAFGEQFGALAVWLEWIESVVWLPTVLSFLATNLAYTLPSYLTENRFYMLIVMLAMLWGGTFFNFLGTKTSSLASMIGIILGSIIPGIAIIVLGALWVTKGQPIHINLSYEAFFPTFNLSTMTYFTAIALGFAGIEVAAFYVQDTKDPKHTFPRATFIATIIIIAIYVLGALSIAMVIPKEEMTLSAGMMQAMSKFFIDLQLSWAIPIFALLSVIGGLALLNTWLIGPSKGLHSSAMHHDLPKFTRTMNQHGSPIAILLMQAIIGTGLVSMNLFLPTINHFYWIFQIQAAQLILLMYLLIFLSVIKLRYSQPHTFRPYQIPGGKIGLWLINVTGSLFCIGAFLLGFVPPEEYQFMEKKIYAFILLMGIIIFSAPPFLYRRFRKKNTIT